MISIVRYESLLALSRYVNDIASVRDRWICLFGVNSISIASRGIEFQRNRLAICIKIEPIKKSNSSQLKVFRKLVNNEDPFNDNL